MLKPREEGGRGGRKQKNKTRVENKSGILTLFAAVNESLDNFFYPEEMFSSDLGTLLILGPLPLKL